MTDFRCVIIFYGVSQHTFMSDEALRLTGDASTSLPTGRRARRIDLDALRIVLTWSILLYHTVLVYAPFLRYYVKAPATPYTVDTVGAGGIAALVFITWMNAWNMPLFFFLAGIASFHSMTARRELAYRRERVQRLLIPALAVYVATQLLLLPMSRAPLTPPCLAYAAGNRSTEVAEQCALYFPPQPSLTLDAARLYAAATPHQAWFCVYLFVYAQALYAVLRAVHPGLEPGLHRTLSEPSTLAARLLAWIGRRGVGAVVCGPALTLTCIELGLRPFFPDGRYTLYSIAIDWANNLHFCFVYLAGFALTLADDHIHRGLAPWRGALLVVGALGMGVYALIPSSSIAGHLLRTPARGFGEWSFILGIAWCARGWVQNARRWIAALSELAMPFYLLHQQVLVCIFSLTPVRSPVPLFLLTTAATLVLSWLVARVPGLRCAFGLKPWQQEGGDSKAEQQGGQPAQPVHPRIQPQSHDGNPHLAHTALQFSLHRWCREFWWVAAVAALTLCTAALYIGSVVIVILDDVRSGAGSPK